MFDAKFRSSQVQARTHSLSFILHQKSSKSIYKQKSSTNFNVSLPKPRNNISYTGPRGLGCPALGSDRPESQTLSTKIPYDFCPDLLVRLQLFPFRDKLVLDARNEATSRLGLLMMLHAGISTKTSWDHVFE